MRFQQTKWSRHLGKSAILLLILVVSQSCGSELDFDGRSSLPELPERITTPPDDQNQNKTPDNNDNNDLLADRDKKKEDTTPPKPAERPITRNFYWNWNCQKSTFNESDQKSALKESFIAGRGSQFKVKLTDDERGKISIYGNICDFSHEPTDIVIVIDVSDSMHDKDPRVSSSCSRLESLRRTVKVYADNDQARFALITFDDNIKYTSTGFQSADSFLKSNANSYRTVCDGDDTARYSVGFEKAIELFTESPSHNYRELIFLSDGQPEKSYEGVEEAAKMKDFDGGNVVISAIQLGNNQTVSLDNYTSAANSGEKFFRKITDKNEMADVTEKLIKPTFATGFFYIKDPEYIKLEPFPIEDLTGGSVFQLEISDVERDKYPTGLRLIFDYSDNRGRNLQYSGTLIWE